MDLRFTEAERAFCDEVRGWIEANLPAEWRQAGGVEIERAWQRRVFDGGWAGVHWPAEHGGRGASPIEHFIFTEEMGLAGAPELMNRVGVNLVGPTIVAHGTREQRARYLKPILSADEIWCQLYSEPGAGSDLASLRTRADRVGDTFVLNGQKVWSSYAELASFGMALVRTDPDAPAHRGISCLLVPLDSPGIEIRPLRQITGESEFCEVFFTDARVPGSMLLGNENDGWRVAMTTLGHERGVGFPVKEWAVQRVAFERLLALPRGRMGLSLRQRAARAWTELEIYRLLNLRTVTALASGREPGPETSVTKLHWAGLSQRLTELALDVIGPGAEQWTGSARAPQDGWWARRHLWSRAASIAGGTDEVQRNILAERVLGMPRQ